MLRQLIPFTKKTNAFGKELVAYLIRLCMWTNSNSRSYLSLTLHFVEDGIWHHCVVVVDHFVSDTISGKNVRGAFVKFLEERGYIRSIN